MVARPTVYWSVMNPSMVLTLANAQQVAVRAVAQAADRQRGGRCEVDGVGRAAGVEVLTDVRAVHCV